MLRHAGRASAAPLIAGHSVVDEFWIVEIQGVHQRDKLFQRAVAAESWIACLFLADGADAALRGVVAGIHQGVVVIGK